MSCNVDTYTHARVSWKNLNIRDAIKSAVTLTLNEIHEKIVRIGLKIRFLCSRSDRIYTCMYFNMDKQSFSIILI